MDITYYGHSCFGARIGNKHVLFDPFITPNDLAKNKVKIEQIAGRLHPAFSRSR